MLTLLAKLLGPDRGVTAYVALTRFGIPVALFLGFAAVFGVILLLTRADRMEHVAYFEAEILAVSPLTQDPNAGVFVDIRLPNGEEMQLTETEGVISSSLTDVACMESRRDRETGELSYRLRRAIRCEG